MDLHRSNIELILLRNPFFEKIFIILIIYFIDLTAVTMVTMINPANISCFALSFVYCILHR